MQKKSKDFYLTIIVVESLQLDITLIEVGFDRFAIIEDCASNNRLSLWRNKKTRCTSKKTRNRQVVKTIYNQKNTKNTSE